MDPISSAASILAVVGATQDGVKISLKFLRIIRRAPRGLQALLDEVTQIEAVLSDVKIACEYGQKSSPALDLLLKKAATKLLQLNKLVHFKLVKAKGGLEVDRLSFARYRGEIAELKDDLTSLRHDITALLCAATLAQANQAKVDLCQISRATMSKAPEHAITIESLSSVQYAMQELFKRIEESQETQRALTNMLGEFRTESPIHTTIRHTTPVLTSNVMTCPGVKLRQEHCSPTTTTQSNTNVGTELVTTVISSSECSRSVPKGTQGRFICHQGFRTRASEIIESDSYFFAKMGQLKALQFHYIDGLASVHDVDTDYRNNALTLAVMYEHLNIARFLLDSGADPNCENFNGLSPIHCVLDLVLKAFDPKSCAALAWLSLFDLDFDNSFGALPCLHRIVLGFSTRELEDELLDHRSQ
ncbi:hypothetical protein MMC27_000090 [Xylographa pallens]|nr:hypothetical protein [Xylographa pallens]